MQGITSAGHAERVARDVVSAGGLFEGRATFHVLVQSAAVTPVRSTVDDAIDMVIAELGIGSKRDSKRDIDLIDLVRLAIHARTRDAGVSFEDVVTRYDATPGEVRGWSDNWS